MTWKPRAVGDIFVGSIQAPVMGSWFGGGANSPFGPDPGDNGETASGVMNDGSDPGLMGCALPFPTSFADRGSPIPLMPYRTTMVEVTHAVTGVTITIPVLDDGPALDAPDNAAIDLTQASFMALGGTKAEGLIPVYFRIIGGAQYLL